MTSKETCSHSVGINFKMTPDFAVTGILCGTCGKEWEFVESFKSEIELAARQDERRKLLAELKVLIMKELNSSIKIKGIEKRQYYASACKNIFDIIASLEKEVKP